ncbi:hypothetical protein BD769DRAFT_1526195 [Suillus cothurnatus]|nr:hypothetical protein BD769DRAFT_1526195 [Suillus cothurnatus]
MRREIALRLYFFFALFFAPVWGKYRNVTVVNTDPSIQYAGGNWSMCTIDDLPSYGGSRNCSNDVGTTATFKFTGVAIYYIEPLIANVTTVLTLDSGPPVLVNLTQTPGQNATWAVRWGASGLNNGPHTLVNYGPSNTITPSGKWGEVNALIYTVVEQDDNVAAIAGGAVAGAVALALMGICWFFGQDWLRHLAFVVFGWLLFRGRRFTFISDVPHETQITLFLTLTKGLPQLAGEDQVLSWKVLEIGPARRQEVVRLPSRGRTGDPGLVFCTLEAIEKGFKAKYTSSGAACDLIQKDNGYEWAPSDRRGISVANRAPDGDSFALAGVPQDFSDREFLANRITEEDGYEVSKLGPMTYWYVHEKGDRLKIKIGKSRKDIKRYKHQLELDGA